MTTSATKELTIAPNAAPIITPTARSTTLPRMANFLNSSSIGPPPIDDRSQRTLSRSGANQAAAQPSNRASIDQPGVHHGLADQGLRLFGGRHHRQPQRIGAFTDQRQRIFDRSRTCFDKQIDVQRSELVL